MTYNLILKGGTVVSPGGMTQTDVGVIGERIAHIGNLTGVDAGEVYDATGLHILPGVIDSQVHFREPGPTLQFRQPRERETDPGIVPAMRTRSGLSRPPSRPLATSVGN